MYFSNENPYSCKLHKSTVKNSDTVKVQLLECGRTCPPNAHHGATVALVQYVCI